MAAFMIHEDMEESRHVSTKCGGRRVLATITNINRTSRLPSKTNRCPLKTLTENHTIKCFEDRSKIVTTIAEDVERRKIPSPRDLDESMNTPECIDKTLEQMSIDKSFTETKSLKKVKAEQVIYLEPLYRKEILRYLYEAEVRHKPHPLYMKKQPELNDGMRCILVDWLVSVSDEYNFAHETLYLAVSYVDRFLSKMSVVRAKLQLVGVTAMMIAAKYEEIYPPDTNEFIYLTNNTYTVKQLLRMEQMMLRVLSFDLTTPTTQTFLDEYVVQANLSQQSQNLAMYLSELCLVESVSYVQYLPSQLAASSVALSRHTLEEKMIWPKELENLSGYTLSMLTPLLKQQHKVFVESPTKTLQAVRQKFGKPTLSQVSKMNPKVLVLDD